MLATDQQQATAERAKLNRPCRAALCKLLAALVVLGLIAASASAGPFSELIVFGDSLSDVGNVAQATDEFYPLAPRTPGPYYYNGRFSNGPVYAEALANGLGLPPLMHSRNGGDNFAHGGAKTSGTSFPNSLAVRDTDDQFTDFLNARNADATTLYLIFAGANDLLDGQTNMSVPVNRLATDIGRLVADGARNFFVFNLPPLGHTPRFNGNSNTLATYNARSQQFNTALSTMLDGLETSNAALNIFRFDVAALFNEALANPLSFGLTNVTAPAAPGLQPGASSYNTSQIALNANEYMFWDDLHPTAAVHAILSQRALSALATPGDFNGDWAVDAADYVASRKAVDAPYTHERYTTWRENFGQSAGFGGIGAAGAIVPEPTVYVLLITVMAVISAPRRRAKLQ